MAFLEEMEQPGSFERIESKFLAPVIYQDLFEAYANAYLAPAYPNPDTQFVDIESLYFDSRHLGFFQHHLERRSIRSKMRLRRYAPDGVFSKDSPCFSRDQR